jgi:hypothetical protein
LVPVVYKIRDQCREYLVFFFEYIMRNEKLDTIILMFVLVSFAEKGIC